VAWSSSVGTHAAGMALMRFTQGHEGRAGSMARSTSCAVESAVVTRSIYRSHAASYVPGSDETGSGPTASRYPHVSSAILETAGEATGVSLWENLEEGGGRRALVGQQTEEATGASRWGRRRLVVGLDEEESDGHRGVETRGRGGRGSRRG